MAIAGAQAIRQVNPEMPIVLGGISPIDPNFHAVDGILRGTGPRRYRRRARISAGLEPLEHSRVAAEDCERFALSPGSRSGFPRRAPLRLAPKKCRSSGLQKTAELLLPMVERVHWYSLFDLPATWTATTRHKESEGSAYYRHYYMGLVREDMTPKQAAACFPSGWELPVVPFRRSAAGCGSGVAARLGVRYLRTGVSWADWFRPELRKLVRSADDSTAPSRRR